jgi:hypothetical protein
VTFTVDTHHHILPDFFWQATEKGGDSERTAILGATAMALIPRLATLRSRAPA